MVQFLVSVQRSGARDFYRLKMECVMLLQSSPSPSHPPTPPSLHAHSHVCILMKLLISCLEISLKICMCLPQALEGSLKYVLAALLSPCL